MAITPDGRREAPTGYRLKALLASSEAMPGTGPRREVWRAERDGEPVLLRLEWGEGGQDLGELAVLAAIDHPGLARLVDHGAWGDGGRYLARAWIEGRDLASRLAAEPSIDPRRLGRWCVGLCASLAALHRAGFVHADLKAENVIVTDRDDVVLTDFGLARPARRAGDEVSGSAFAIAPEVLRGAPVDARADLFALGVLLVRAFGGVRVPAREFYGRFPAVDFFEAAGSRPEELPAWIADLVTALVARDPEQRPPSAAAVGRAWIARLGLDPSRFDLDAAKERPRFDVRTAFAAPLARWSDELRGLRGRTWLRIGHAGDAEAFARELRVRLALSGAAVIGSSPPRGATQAAVEVWIESILSAVRGAAPSSGGIAVAAIADDDASRRRAIEGLARALSSREGLIVVAARAPVAAELSWREESLAPVDAAAVSTFVDRELPEEPASAREAFARSLHLAGGGSCAGVDLAIARAFGQGLWLPGGRLRPGTVPGPGELAARAGFDRASVDANAREVVDVLTLLRGRASLSVLATATATPPRSLTPTLAGLESAGWLARRAGDPSPWVESTVPLDPGSLSAAERRRSARGLARAFAGEGPQAWGHLAGDVDVDAFVEQVADARDAGSPEAALSACEDARWGLGPALDRRIEAEAALCLVQCGELDRASAQADALAASHDPRLRAAAERIRGRVGLARHDPEVALECFDRAAALDPGSAGEAWLARVQWHSQAGRDAELLEVAGRVPADASTRTREAVDSFAAMSRLRLGDVEGARAALRMLRDSAKASGDLQREASTLTNLGSLERRAGRLDQALEHFEAADRLAARLRSPSFTAQVRGAFAVLLREVGQLARAEELAESTIALRQRIGDLAGAHVARGVLALTLAERGHVARAATESELAAAALDRVGRRADVALLEATAYECRARLGRELPSAREGEWERAREGDPRSLLCLARAHAQAGDEASALEWARRAQRLAAGLKLERVEVQARDWLEACANPRQAPRAADAGDSISVRAELALHAGLASEPFDSKGMEALAREFERLGRDDRAARAWIAVAARAQDPKLRRAAFDRSRERLALCALGAGEEAQAALAQRLLAIREPWPEDHVLARAAVDTDQESEMDVLRLLEINHRLLDQPDLNTLLGEIVDCALSVSGAERGFLVLEKDGDLEFDTAMDSRRGDIPLPEVEVSRSILAEALEKMSPLRVSNAAADPEHGAAASVIALDLRSVLVAPFRIDRQSRGVIYVDHRLKSGAFTERAERMLALLSDQAALAIQQVRRLDEIRRLNRRLNQRVAETESELRTSQRALVAAGLPMAPGGLIGSSAAMREVHRRIEMAADTRLSVLLLGQSGSGKELAARALHARSARSLEPFVAENCAGLPPSLVEAELFGVKRGAYSGAERDRSGLFERAHRGSLFLDEIGELSLEIQAKLLRVLETGEVRRVGGEASQTVDFRLITATHRDLAREVREGRFRADLFYRLDGLRIDLPPLDQRREDIPELVDHFLRQSAEPGTPARRVSKDVMAKLCARAWPGNVRELRNEVARLCVLSPGDIDDASLVSQQDVALSALAPNQLVTLADLERDAILRALRAADGDKNVAARTLGISRAKIYQRLKEWGEGV